MKKLDFQDKLSYFLFNYRNSCLTSGEGMPADKILNYRPKTIIDLINPNKTFKKHLVQRSVENPSSPIQPNDEREDALAKLAQGDKVLYKNHKLRELPRWTEATFVKQISPNVFQIAIGSNVISAHREQIRPKEGRRRRHNVALQYQEKQGRGTKRRVAESDEDEDPFRGFDISMEQPPPTRSEFHPACLKYDSANERPVIVPRRSARLKKKIRCEEFDND